MYTKRYPREYSTWVNMLRRCYAEDNKDSANYLERGIDVCPEWRESFWNFLRDMKEKPDGLTLEREDNSKGYSPRNCVWADRTQQCVNRRRFKNNKSGATGVCQREDSGRWRAYANLYGKRKNLGTFETKEEAVEVRNQFLKESK